VPSKVCSVRVLVMTKEDNINNVKIPDVICSKRKCMKSKFMNAFDLKSRCNAVMLTSRQIKVKPESCWKLSAVSGISDMNDVSGVDPHSTFAKSRIYRICVISYT
jgi:hypothetical protein